MASLILMSENKGVWRGEVGSYQWEQINEGLTVDHYDGNLEALAVGSNVLWLALGHLDKTLSGLWKRTNPSGSGSWTEVSLPNPVNDAGDDPPPTHAELWSWGLRIVDSTIYLLRHGFFEDPDRNRTWIYVSPDAGVSWQSYQLYQDTYGYDVAPSRVQYGHGQHPIDIDSEGNVYVAVQDRYLDTSRPYALLKLSDSTVTTLATWPNTWLNGVVVDKDDNVYAYGYLIGGPAEGVLVKSEDRGETWLSLIGRGEPNARVVLPSLTTSGDLVAVLNYHVWYSPDGGASWVQKEDIPAQQGNCGIRTGSLRTVIGERWAYSVHESRDGWATWDNLDADDLIDDDVWGIVEVAPAIPARTYFLLA